MPIAKWVLKPNNDVLDYVDIVDKHSSYGSTDSWKEEGYLYSSKFSNVQELNSTAYLTFKAKEGYRINACYKTFSEGNFNNGNFPINEDGSVTVYPWVRGMGVVLTNYLYLTVEKDIEKPKPKPKPKISIKLNLENCTANIDSELEEGTYTVVLTANKGYEFSSYGSYTDGTLVTRTIYPSDTDKTVTVPFNFVVSEKYRNLEINMVATKQVEKLTSFVNLYSVDNDILTELSKVRFMENNLQGLIDYGTFITNLTQIDFSLPSDLIDEGKNIILGNFDTGIVASQLKKYLYEMFLGEIEVPQKYHNSYDYINTICRLHVPYLNVIELPVEYVVGYKIGITFYIDLYSCEFTMNVSSSFSGGIIHSENGRIGVDIPFIQKQSSGVVNQLSPNIRNNIRKPYVEVIRNIPYDVKTDFGKESLDYGKLINFSGYIEVENIMLNTSATNEEKNRIITQLRNGVVIR